MRFRNTYLILGSVLVVLLWLLSDPQTALVQNLPFGASTIASLVLLSKTVLYAGALHFTRKALIDYIDLEEFFKMALKSPEGSGLAIVGVSIFCVAIAMLIQAAV